MITAYFRIDLASTSGNFPFDSRTLRVTNAGSQHVVSQNAIYETYTEDPKTKNKPIRNSKNQAELRVGKELIY